MKNIKTVLTALLTLTIVGWGNSQTDNSESVFDKQVKNTGVVQNEDVIPMFTDVTFFQSDYNLWSEGAIVPFDPSYDSNYDPNILVCSTNSTIPLGSLLEISFENSRREIRIVKVVVTENFVLSDENIGIVMEREAFTQLFEYNKEGYLPTNFTRVSYIILDNLK